MRSEKQNFYMEIIENSMKKITDFNSFLFRMGNYWYRYENWNLRDSGIIRRWNAFDKDFVPKKSYNHNYNRQNSHVIFDIDDSLNIFGLKKSMIRSVAITEDGNLLSFIIEDNKNFDLYVYSLLKKRKICYLTNINLESSFFVGSNGVIYCRSDSNHRPSSLYYFSYSTCKEQLIYIETNDARRIRIFQISTGKGNTCMVSSKDFIKGELFLCDLFKEKTLLTPLVIDSIFSDCFDILHLNKRRYFVLYTKDEISINDVETNKIFRTKVQVRNISFLSCVGNTIILGIGEDRKRFLVIRVSLDKERPIFEKNFIKFPQNVQLYENNYSTDMLFFIGEENFNLDLFTYYIENKKIEREFCLSVLDSDPDICYNKEVIWTHSNDYETSIPITLVWKSKKSRSFPRKQKCIFSVYGAYGKNDDVTIDSTILSIIEAGFIFATIHVRGGGFLGGDWYRAGKGLKKWNSIKDFIHGVRYLVDRGFVDEHHLGVISSSAGGIVAGATLNEDNNLFRSMLLFSPFINPFEALQCRDDPMSKTELFEWGDIRDANVKNYIYSYSPQQNVEKSLGSKTKVISILGARDPYINNQHVIKWSDSLNSFGVESKVYLNPNAGHGGISESESHILIKILSHFLEIVSSDIERKI